MAKGPEQEHDRNSATHDEKDAPKSTPADLTLKAVASPSTEKAISAEGAERQPSGKGDRPQDKEDWEPLFYELEKRNIHVQWMLAVIAFFALVVGGYQLYTMRIQNQVMISQNRIMLAQQRPLVSIEVDVAEKPQADKPWFFHFTVENCGQTTANLRDIVFDVIYFKPGEPINSVGLLSNSKERSLRVQDGTKTDHPGVLLEGLNEESRKFDLLIKQGFNSRLARRANGQGHIAVGEFFKVGESRTWGGAKAETLSGDLVADIEAGKAIPVIFAAVNYLDGARESHTSRITGIYDKGRQVLIRSVPVGPEDEDGSDMK